MSDLEDTTGRLHVSGRHEVCRDRISGRYAVVSPADETVGWYDSYGLASEAARALNGEE